MPANAGSPTPLAYELTAIAPRVSLAGTDYSHVYCLHIEDSTGILPSKAFIQVGGATDDVAGPITLNANGWDRIKRGTRTLVNWNNQLLHAGNLVKRHDQGALDSIVWESWDDRWLLSKIPVFGCLVYDPNDSGAVKFSTRYEMRVNPQGFRNCIGANVPGWGLTPIFSWVAEAHDNEYVNEPITDQLQVGVLCAWTPRRLLQYLCCLANMYAGQVPGTSISGWRSLKFSTRLSWPRESLNFSSGTDVDHKLPDTTYQGGKMLGVIGQALKNVQTYGVRIHPHNGTSRLEFYSEIYGGQMYTIPLQRGGDADNINTAFDFELHDDASNIAEAAMVLGDVAREESSLLCDINDATAPLVPAWTAAEEDGAKRCLAGAEEGDPAGTYCQYPAVINQLAGAWLTADGSDPGVPPIHTGSKEAVAFMRQFFPKVWRAFKLDSLRLKNLGIILGSNSIWSDTNLYPILYVNRPILEEQLSFIKGTDGGELKAKWPVRVQLSIDGGTTFRDVTTNHGIRCDAEGTIWIDGLTDENAGGENLYGGSMLGKETAWEIETRKFKLNAAFPTDHRVIGYAEAQGDIDGALDDDLGGPLLEIVDAPRAFRLEDRYASSPTAAPQYLRGSEADVYPVTGLLRDERAHANAHAQQRVDGQCKAVKTSSWKMIGIRPEYRAGTYITEVALRNAAAGDKNFKVEAALHVTTWDFMEYITICGGLITRPIVPFRGVAAKPAAPTSTAPQRAPAASGPSSPEQGPSSGTDESGRPVVGKAGNQPSGVSAPAGGGSGGPAGKAGAGGGIPSGKSAEQQERERRWALPDRGRSQIPSGKSAEQQERERRWALPDRGRSLIPSGKSAEQQERERLWAQRQGAPAAPAPAAPRVNPAQAAERRAQSEAQKSAAAQRAAGNPEEE